MSAMIHAANRGMPSAGVGDAVPPVENGAQSSASSDTPLFSAEGLAASLLAMPGLYCDKNPDDLVGSSPRKRSESRAKLTTTRRPLGEVDANAPPAGQGGQGAKPSLSRATIGKGYRPGGVYAGERAKWQPSQARRDLRVVSVGPSVASTEHLQRWIDSKEHGMALRELDTGYCSHQRVRLIAPKKRKGYFSEGNRFITNDAL